MIQHNDSHYPDDDLAMTKLPAEFHAMMTAMEQIFGALEKPKESVWPKAPASPGTDPNDQLHGKLAP